MRLLLRYSFSGKVAASAYKEINTEGIKRVFILGPSHHAFIEGCGISTQTHYDTPFGELTLDTDVINELLQTKNFIKITNDVDEGEHSLELHLPFVAKVFKGVDIKVVPIMVGSAERKASKKYAKLFSKYFMSDENFWVISSDFCHWGKRFSYVYVNLHKGDICDSIEWLDRLGMQTIEDLDSENFRKYRDQYKNTICGRCPVLLLMHTIEECKRENFKLKFIDYAQSSKCKTMEDSSVSYASAIVWRDLPDQNKRKRTEI